MLMCYRLRQSTTTTAEATVSSITALQDLLKDAQVKLDLLLLPPSEPANFVPPPLLDPDSLALTDEDSLLDYDSNLESTQEKTVLTREKELLVVGIGGAIAGLAISVLFRLIGFSS